MNTCRQSRREGETLSKIKKMEGVTYLIAGLVLAGAQVLDLFFG